MYSIKKFVCATVLGALFSLPFAAHAQSPFEKTTTTQQVRILTYNVDRNYPSDDPATEAAFRRLIQAIHPDVIALQGLPESAAKGSPSTLAGLLEKSVKSTDSKTKWKVWVGSTDGLSRNALISRHPLSMTTRDTTPPSKEVHGITSALVQLPAQPFDNTSLYIMNVNFKAGDTEGTNGDFARRQKHADAIMNWILDATTPAKMGRPGGDKINLKARTPILIVGDYHFTDADRDGSGPYHAARTLLLGAIQDKKTYGEGRLPDWDGTPLATVRHQPLSKKQDTTLKKPALSAHIVYTDSVLSPTRCTQVDTSLFSAAELKASGLQAGDTELISQYSPVFADFMLGTSAQEPPAKTSKPEEKTEPEVPALPTPAVTYIKDTETGPTLPTVNP